MNNKKFKLAEKQLKKMLEEIKPFTKRKILIKNTSNTHWQVDN